MKHNYEAIFHEGEPDERLPEWHVVKWDSIRDGNKLGHKIAAFYQDGEAEAKALTDLLNKNPIWISVDNGDIFEGHQGHWADCFFSNSFERQIRQSLDNDNFFQTGDEPKPSYVIREMTDEELMKFPDALEFREYLLKQYGEF